MTIKAGIEIDWARAALRCIIYERQSAEGIRVVEADDSPFNPGGLAWKRHEDDGARRDQSIGFTIPEDAALVLLDALLNHFRGGHDARQLRADYDAERARVDRLINALLEPT